MHFSYWCMIYAYRLRFARIISTLCTCHQWSEVSESKGLSSPPLPPPLPARPLKLLPPVPLPTAPRPSAGKKVNSARQRRSSRKACSCLPLPHLIIDPSNSFSILCSVLSDRDGRNPLVTNQWVTRSQNKNTSLSPFSLKLPVDAIIWKIFSKCLPCSLQPIIL